MWFSLLPNELKYKNYGFKQINGRKSFIYLTPFIPPAKRDKLSPGREGEIEHLIKLKIDLQKIAF